MKKNILIIVLLLIVAGLSVFIIYDKTLKQEAKPKETKKEVKEEVLDVTSQEVLKLLNNVNLLAKNNHSDVYYGYLYKKDSLKAEEMDDDLIVAIGVYHEHLKCTQSWDEKCIKTTSENPAGEVTIPAENVKKVINEILGDIKYVNTDIKSVSCSGGYKYNKNDNYVGIAPACGYAGDSYDFLETKIAKAIRKDKSLDIYVKVAFGHYDFNENEQSNNSLYHIYNDFNKTSEIYKAKEGIYDFDEVLLNYADKLPLYKLHFEKENDNYHFKGSYKQ
ncbi:MAG: hypothetical protein IKG27_00620 [Bacilli bacterium]|nr:hypothetical protein [Bacilli bacterium]